MIRLLTESARARRNQNPHAPARAAMWLFPGRYARQGGGSMDFWDSLDRGEKRLARDCAEEIGNARPMTAQEMDDENALVERHPTRTEEHAMPTKHRISIQTAKDLRALASEVDAAQVAPDMIAARLRTIADKLDQGTDGRETQEKRPKRKGKKASKSR